MVEVIRPTVGQSGPRTSRLTWWTTERRLHLLLYVLSLYYYGTKSVYLPSGLPRTLFFRFFFLTRTLVLLFNLLHFDADATIRLEDFTLLLPIVKNVMPQRIMSVCCFCQLLLFRRWLFIISVIWKRTKIICGNNR